jgi:transcriptional regulator with XRE-family HTH domain
MYEVNSSSDSQKKMSLKQLRKKLNLSQTKFAELLGSDRSEVSRIENGRIVPEWYLRAIKLNVLAKSAGVSLEDLIISLPPTEEPQE